MKVFVWEILFKPELQILSSNFLCENFFLLPFFIELQIKRVPPQSDIGLGGYSSKFEFENHLSWNGVKSVNESIKEFVGKLKQKSWPKWCFMNVWIIVERNCLIKKDDEQHNSLSYLNIFAICKWINWSVIAFLFCWGPSHSKVFSWNPAWIWWQNGKFGHGCVGLGRVCFRSWILV